MRYEHTRSSDILHLTEFILCANKIAHQPTTTTWNIIRNQRMKRQNEEKKKKHWLRSSNYCILQQPSTALVAISLYIYDIDDVFFFFIIIEYHVHVCGKMYFMNMSAQVSSFACVFNWFILNPCAIHVFPCPYIATIYIHILYSLIPNLKEKLATINNNNKKTTKFFVCIVQRYIWAMSGLVFLLIYLLLLWSIYEITNIVFVFIATESEIGPNNKLNFYMFLFFS